MVVLSCDTYKLVGTITNLVDPILDLAKPLRAVSL